MWPELGQEPEGPLMCKPEALLLLGMGGLRGPGRGGWGAGGKGTLGGGWEVGQRYRNTESCRNI